jgi:hypothetical protein
MLQRISSSRTLMHRRASIFSFMGLTSESTTSAERAEMYVGPGQSVRAVSGRDGKKKKRARGRTGAIGRHGTWSGTN